MHQKSTVSLLWPFQVAIVAAITMWFLFDQASYFVLSFGRNLI